MNLRSAIAVFKGFNPNNWLMYLMYALIVSFISAEALFYLIKSYRKAREIGMDMDKIKQVIRTCASFSVLPAIGIGVGVVTLVAALGIAVPAIRLSVIGALQYETQMADVAAKAITGEQDGLTVLMQRGVTPRDFATMVTLMTISILLGAVLVVLFYKRLQPQLVKLGKLQVKTGQADPEKETAALEKTAAKKDPGGLNLADLAFQISFIGMIIGYISWSISAIAAAPAKLTSYYNFIAVVIAALFMMFCDFLVKKLHWRWLDDFSTAFSMLLAMAVVAIISGTTGQY